MRQVIQQNTNRDIVEEEASQSRQYRHNQILNPDSLQPNPSQNSTQSYDHITKNTSSLSHNLGLHYFRILKTYWNGINEQNLIRFRPEYKQMIHNEYMWHRFLLQESESFSLLKQLFNSQKGPLIFVIIMSAIMGIISLFGAYSQRFLFFQHTQKNYHTSGWVFFGIIMSAAIIRFFLFNYLQTIANEIAINIKIHLQNSFVRCMLKIPNNPQIEQKSLLYFNYFASIEVIYLALKVVPYFISSIVIVFGVIVFVIDIVGWLGLILLGVTLFALCFQIILLYYMFHLHQHYAEYSNKRNSISMFQSQFLLRIIHNGFSSKFLQKLLSYRRKQTNTDIKYTISDGFIQIFAQCAAFTTVFIFYLIEESQGHPSYKQIFQCVVLFSVFKTPVKMMAYGLAFTMEMYGSICMIQEMYENKRVTQNQKIRKMMIFPRLYTHPSKLWQKQDFCVVEQEVKNEIILQKNNLLQKYRGNFVILISDINSSPSCQSYLNQLIQSFPEGTKSILIKQNNFLLNTSILNNIIFGEQYNQQKFQNIIKIVQLNQILQDFPLKQNTILDQNYFKTLFSSVCFKIQIARALYNQVEILIINKNLSIQYQQILINIKNYRKNNFTLLIDQSGLHFKLSDFIILLNKNGISEQGKYIDLISSSQTLKRFISESNTKDEQNFKPNVSSPTLHHRINLDILAQQDTIKSSYRNLLKFYNLNHYGAGFILLVLLIIPPLVDLYMQAIVAESKDFFDQQNDESEEDIHVQEHRITLRYGISLLVFFFANSIKVLVLSIYLRTSSYKIVEQVVGKFIYSKIEKTVTILNNQNALDLERNVQSMDIRTTTEVDIGLTIIFQQLSIIIFATVSSLFFLAVGLPFFVIVIVIYVLMVKYSRQIFEFKKKNRGKMNGFIKKIITHRQQINNLNKNDMIFRNFTQLNEEQVIYELNEDWLLQALSIIFQFIIILMLMTVLIVSILNFHQIHKQNQAFLQLSISFLIGLLNGGRLDLKVFKSIDRQVAGISSIFKMISYHESHNGTHILKDLPYPQIQIIKYSNFSVKLGIDNLSQLNLNIAKGQRLICVGNNKSRKRILFDSLFRMFKSQDITGRMEINGIDIYAQKISREFLQKYIHVLHGQPILELGYTVQKYILFVYPQISREMIIQTLNKIWRIIQNEPGFSIDSKHNQLSAAHLNIFSLLIALLSKPQVLIIDQGFEQLDTESKIKLTKWLIQNRQINILIQLTHKTDTQQLYSRKLVFQSGRLVSDTTNI